MPKGKWVIEPKSKQQNKEIVRPLMQRLLYSDDLYDEKNSGLKRYQDIYRYTESDTRYSY